MPYFSILGYTPNPLIEKYQDAFVSKLENIWSSQIGGDIPSRDFLLYPDIHGLLLASSRPESSQSWVIFAELQDQYIRYQEQWNKYTIDPTEIIAGTQISLTMQFANPDIDKHTHPDHRLLTAGYGHKSPNEWRELFYNVFSIIKKVSPGFMSEIDRLLIKIIPFGISLGSHNSGSYSDVIWHITMSYPIEIELPEIAVLEAILHEYNHNKMNLIMQTEKLILSDMREIYYSPYRPDARHIHGIYLGLHALAGAYWVIWQAHIAGVLILSDSWLEKAVLYTLKNWLSLQILDHHARLTPLWKELLEDMRAVHTECLEYIRKAHIAPEMMARAKSSLVTHYQVAKQRTPGILT